MDGHPFPLLAWIDPTGAQISRRSCIPPDLESVFLLELDAEAEVRHAQMAVLVQKQVVRLQVAVDDLKDEGKGKGKIRRGSARSRTRTKGQTVSGRQK